jgi:SAM-dependent methyltransferase
VHRATLSLLLLFAVTLFVSATLLFLVQPMIGKMLLPMLGGTPAVWNTCMVFFQALLLAGYLYAHATTSWLGVRRQAALHLAVLLLPLFTLGLTVDRGLLDYNQANPIPRLLLVLLLSVGLPFFVVSTSAPLLQKWFAGTGHPAAADPYFLYGASNLGSMLALFGYPLMIEPYLTLANQRLVWQVGYGLLAVLIAACAVCLWRSAPDKVTRWQEDKAIAGETPPGGTLSLGRRLRWVALAFVPSSLMLGVTTYMTTDIAGIPLLWVLPLGLYLLSFILVFSRLPAVVHRLMVVLLPFAVMLLVFLILSDFPLTIVGKIGVHLTVLFLAAMVCHGELARDRPSTRFLTEFYLWMSVGGVLGGLFNALVAPLIFTGIVEYPLAVVLACLLAPTLEEDEQVRPSTAFETVVLGLCLGAGIAMLLPALARGDLNLEGLAGPEGLWLIAALGASLLLVGVLGRGDPRDRRVRWLDLGLPAALAVLVAGLNLGMRLSAMHQGLVELFHSVHAALPAWVPHRLARLLNLNSTGVLVLCCCILPVLLCGLFMRRPLRFGLGIAAVLLATAFCDLLQSDIVLRDRSFFGVLVVNDDGQYRRLEHGTTLHGHQRRHWSRTATAAGALDPLAASDPLGAAVLLAAWQDNWHNPGREPLTYFHRTGPIGQVFTAYQDQLAGRSIGLIGLGTGTLASYGQPGQKLTYYEIDPLVQRIAFDPAYFTYVQDARDRGVAVEVVLGDARLKLEERARNGQAEKFALLIVDAFSSDAIPLHLLTRQALDIYLDNLAPDGLLVFHISNRYLDLEPVLGNLAAEVGLTGFLESDAESAIPGKASSSWVILARQESTLNRLLHEGRWGQWKAASGATVFEEVLQMLFNLPNADGGAHALSAAYLAIAENLQAPWHRLQVRPEVGVWTDDYSNLLRVFDWKH